MIRSWNPVHDAQRYYDEQEELHRKWMRGQPWCNVCLTQISDDKCYVIDKWDSMHTCICKDCMDKEMKKLERAGLDALLKELIEETISTECGLVETLEQTRWRSGSGP